MEDVNAWSIGRKLIRNAEKLDISTRYRVVTEYPIGKSNDGALFPAIAIPVETKRGYECPDDHLECLGAYLPKITKVIAMGWRGSEQNILGFLRESLPVDVPLLAVSENQRQAQAVLNNFDQAGLRMVGRPAKVGFSDFVVSREAEEFLRS